MENLWKVWLVVAGVMTGLYFVLPKTPGAKLILFTGLGLLAAAVVAASAIRSGRADRVAWLWIAAGLASFAVADVLYFLPERQGPPTFPSIADFFYLAMYPLIAIGVTRLRPADSRGTVLEASVVGTALFCALWLLYVSDIAAAGMEGTARLVSMAYPIMGVVLAVAATRLIVATGDVPIAILVGGLASLTFADIMYNIALNNGTFRVGSYIDLFWVAFYAMVAAAALYRPVAAPQPDTPNEPPAPTAREIASVLR